MKPKLDCPVCNEPAVSVGQKLGIKPLKCRNCQAELQCDRGQCSTLSFVTLPGLLSWPFWPTDPSLSFITAPLLVGLALVSLLMVYWVRLAPR